MINKALLSILIFLASITYCNAASLTLDLATDRSTYRAGEPVKITLSVANKSLKDADLLFGSGQSYDIMITDKSGHDAWHWSRGKVFSMAIRNKKIEPRQTLKYLIIWKQLDKNGLPVAAGKYLIRGRLMTAEPLDSPQRTIIIK
jgi:hypothetical protein